MPLVAACVLLLSACAGVPARAPAPVQAAQSGQTSTQPNTQARPHDQQHSGILVRPQQGLTSTELQRNRVATLDAPNTVWERMRRGFQLAEPQTPQMVEQLQWYSARPEYIQRMAERSGKYLFHIVDEVERRGLPMELALLPFIESAFNPQAVSSARAAGIWQFMPATGASFDLHQNRFRDDRRDVQASTRAALDYLEQLHKRFGDWHLALAAYNWGQGNLNRAITRNQEAGRGTGYTELDLPAETRQYVPKLHAVKAIFERPEAFNIQLPPVGNHPFFESVALQRDMDVALISRLADISEADFRALNPSIKLPVVLAALTPQVLLPWDNVAQFQERLRQHQGPLASWTVWVAPKTMSPAQAAAETGMGESQLRQLNQIPPRMLVQAGSRLLVQRSGPGHSDVPEHVAQNSQIKLQPEMVLRRTSVRVLRGDTLGKLADRHGVSEKQIAEWNPKSSKGKLKAGQSLVLVLPQRAVLAEPEPSRNVHLSTVHAQAQAQEQEGGPKARPKSSKEQAAQRVADPVPPKNRSQKASAKASARADLDKGDQARKAEKDDKTGKSAKANKAAGGGSKAVLTAKQSNKP